MTDTSNDQPGKPDITIQAPSDMPAEKQQAVQATVAWMTDDMAQEVRKNPGGGFAKMIESSRGDQAELMRLVDRHGEQFIATLPRAVQDDIRALQQQNMKKINDDDDFRRRRQLEDAETYGAVGIAGVRESNILEMGLHEGGGNVSLSSSIDNMSTGERFQYFDKAVDMTLAEWQGKTDEERRKILENLKKDGAERLDKGNKTVDEATKEILNDPKYGATPEERKKRLDAIKAATDIDHNKGEAAANIAKLPPEDQAIAKKLRRGLVDIYHGENAIKYTDQATDCLNKGDVEGAFNAQHEAARDAYYGTKKNIENNTGTIKNANVATASGQKVAAAAAKDTDNTLAKSTNGLNDEQVADVKTARDAETKAGIQAHAQVAKQEFVQKAALDGDALGDDPAPAQVAIGGRKSIDIPNGANGEPIVGPLSGMLAQLGKPMEAEKAEEPEVKPENQQPKAPKTTLET